MFKKLLILFFVFINLGCGSENSDENTVSSLSFDQSEISQTLEKLRDLNQFDALNQVFISTPDEDLRLIRQAIQKAQSALQILSRFKNEKKLLETAYTELSTSVYLVDNFNLLQINDDRINRVFNDVRVLKSKLARDLGKPFETWVLYKNNFADGIEPEFRAPGGKDTYGDINWVTNFQIDIPKAKIQARSGHAWMVSRAFDLKNVEAPSFRFHASYLVTSSDGQLPLYEVIKRVFKTYIILDLKPNESIEDVPDSRKILVEYSPDEIPKARDFHDEWLPLRSLEEYKDHEISIGFLFDTREIEFKQFYGWDIYDFEIIGAGSFKTSPYLYQPRLNEKLGGFQSLTQIFSGTEWNSGRDGAYINANSTRATDSVLLSPFITLSPKLYQDIGNVTLILNESFNNVTDVSDVQVLVSTDYRVGLPINFENQNWTELERIYPLGEEQLFDLKPFADKDFFIAFRFKSEATGGLPKSWDLINLTIESQGVALSAIPFLSPDSNDQVEIFKTFDFLNDNYREYKKVYSTEDDSAQWRKNTTGVNISAYNGQDNPAFKGASRINTPSVVLRSVTNVVRLKHTIGFLNAVGPLKIQIREACEEPDESLCEEWVDVGFPDSTFKRIDDPEYSSWVEVDDRFKDKEVEFSFFYQGQGNNNPNWTLILFEVASPQR